MNPLFLLVLLLLILFAAILALYAWSYRTRPGAIYLAVFLSTVALANLVYLLEMFTPDLAGKMLWVRVRYTFTLITVPLYPLLALWYAGQSHWLTPKRLALVYAPAALSLVIFLTNDFHHLHYAGVGLDTSGSFPMLAKTIGPAYAYYRR